MNNGAEMTVDTTKVVTIENSSGTLILLTVLSFLMVGLSIALIFGTASDTPEIASLNQIAGYVGIVFFGFCAVAFLRRFLADKGPVVTLSPEGIKDTRIAEEIIPWRAVREVFVWEYRNQKFVMLEIDPEVERQLTLTKMVRMMRNMSERMGVTGLCVSASGLKTNFVELFTLINGYRT